MTATQTRTASEPQAQARPNRPGNTVVTYQGRSYLLWQGRLLLDWRNRPVLSHPADCLLCCRVRIKDRAGRLWHPNPCGNCGYGTNHRGPRPDPCHLCGQTAHLRGDDGRPVHKACLEHAILTDAAADTQPATESEGQGGTADTADTADNRRGPSGAEAITPVTRIRVREVNTPASGEPDMPDCGSAVPTAEPTAVTHRDGSHGAGRRIRRRTVAVASAGAGAAE